MRTLTICLIAFLAASALACPRAAAQSICHVRVNVPNSTYTLDSDRSCPNDQAVIVKADGVTIDLNGFDVTGNNLSVGIDNSAKHANVKIVNTSLTTSTISHFDQAIRTGGMGAIVKNVRVDNNASSGITVTGGDAALVKKNAGIGNYFGIVVTDGKDALIDGNDMEQSHYGISIASSAQSAKIVHNDVPDNTVAGISAPDRPDIRGHDNDPGTGSCTPSRLCA